MTEIEEYVIRRVKAIREARNWSQQALADNLNVSQSFIRDVESPKRRAKYNLNHLNELCKVFECSFSDLLPEKPL